MSPLFLFLPSLLFASCIWSYKNKSFSLIDPRAKQPGGYIRYHTPSPSIQDMFTSFARQYFPFSGILVKNPTHCAVRSAADNCLNVELLQRVLNNISQTTGATAWLGLIILTEEAGAGGSSPPGRLNKDIPSILSSVDKQPISDVKLRKAGECWNCVLYLVHRDNCSSPWRGPLPEEQGTTSRTTAVFPLNPDKNTSGTAKSLECPKLYEFVTFSRQRTIKGQLDGVLL